jgi:hypothetical protein
VGSLFTAALRAGTVLLILVAYTLNPDTAQYADLIRVVLRAMHSPNCQTLFAILTLFFLGAEMLFDLTSSAVSVTVSRSSTYDPMEPGMVRRSADCVRRMVTRGSSSGG